MKILENLEAVVLDMDGVIFIGGRLRLGARELVERLVSLGVQYHILTNTSGRSVPEISARLASMGLELPEATISNASEVTVNFIRERAEARTVLTLGGGSGLAHALQIQGFKQIAIENLEDAQFAELLEASPRFAYPLVLGWTREYGYDLATRLLRLEKIITEVYAASADRYFAGESGKLPAVAWLSGSVGALLGKVPINPAKPNAYALAYVLRNLRSAAVRTAVIGDSISDIQSGNAAGCVTILLLGGATSADQLENLRGEEAPSHVIQELTDLL